MKKQDVKAEKAVSSKEKSVPPFRQILIETDGTQVILRKSEVSKIELVSIMNMIIDHTARANTELTKTK